ncbi:hypothetical protein NKR19_g3425 [Coniochaeta hoffmannii]|uniref:Uncharacterized protein n=1 Tax=Coniochaeta hoffmannii TaxID=91930 RepID=A0AA38SEQ3_9PEZI|nr:hypothetical protein NKR19_g3425 [Coniochaeta hoffmannii]
MLSVVVTSNFHPRTLQPFASNGRRQFRLGCSGAFALPDQTEHEAGTFGGRIDTSLSAVFSHQDLEQADATLRAILADYRTATRAKGSWVHVITEFCSCLELSPWDFGAWASDSHSTRTAVTMLQLEFRTKVLEDKDNTRLKDSVTQGIAAYIGLPTAHLLALWFGADVGHIPEDRTFSIIRTTLCSEDNGHDGTVLTAERQVRNFVRFVETYRKGLGHWAERVGLDINQRFDKRTANSLALSRSRHLRDAIPGSAQATFRCR